MEYPSTLNHDLGILQQVLPVNAPEVPFAAPEHQRHDIHRSHFDQPRARACAAYVGGRTATSHSPASSFATAIPRLHVVDELAERLGMPALRPRL